MSVKILIVSDPGVDGFRREIVLRPGVAALGETGVQVHVRLSRQGAAGKAVWQHYTHADDACDKIGPLENVLGVVAVGMTTSEMNDVRKIGWSAKAVERLLSEDCDNAHGYINTRAAVEDLAGRMTSKEQVLVNLVPNGKVWGEIAPMLSAAEPAPVSKALEDDDEPTDEAVEPVEAVEDEPTDEDVEAVHEVAVQVLHEMQSAAEGVRTARFVPFPRETLLVDRKLVKEYIKRTVYGVQDYAIFDYAWKMRDNVLIEGPTGPGKTMAVRAWAALRRHPLVRVQGDGAVDLQTLLGSMSIDPDGTYWVDGSLSNVLRNGGVILIDEINFISAKMLAAFYSLLDAERTLRIRDNNGEVIKAHKDVTIFATMNPGYAGTNEVNMALRNRFRHFLAWGYDEAVERALGVPEPVIELARALRAEEASSNIETPTPTNALMDLVRISKPMPEGLGIDYAMSNFLNRYQDHERQPVGLVMDAMRSNLKAAIG